MAMRLFSCLSLAAALLISTAAYAQQVTVSGWVQRVDTANAAITIRTLANPRTISVAPDAVIRINGVVSRLDQLPFNSPVSIVAEKDTNGVLRATQIVAQPTERQPTAVAPPGAVVRGTLVGINVPGDTITIRTSAGDYPVTLGTASIYVNGARGSNRDLRLGQRVEVDRTLPTAASTDYVTQIVRVLTPAGRGSSAAGRAPISGGQAGSARGGSVTSGISGGQAGAGSAAGTAGAGLVDRGRLLPGSRANIAVARTRRYGATSRTAGYRRSYRARRTRSYSRTRRSHYRTRYSRTRRVRRYYTSQPM